MQPVKTVNGIEINLDPSTGKFHATLEGKPIARRRLSEVESILRKASGRTLPCWVLSSVSIAGVLKTYVLTGFKNGDPVYDDSQASVWDARYGRPKRIDPARQSELEAIIQEKKELARRTIDLEKRWQRIVMELPTLTEETLDAAEGEDG
jgi:hypothetical protein